MASKEGTVKFRAPEALITAVEDVARRKMMSVSEFTRQSLLSAVRENGVDPAAQVQQSEAA